MAFFLPAAPHGWQWATQDSLQPQTNEMVKGDAYKHLRWGKMGDKSGDNLAEAFHQFCLQKVPQEFNVTTGFNSTYKWNVVAVYGDHCVARHVKDKFLTKLCKPVERHRFLLAICNNPPDWKVQVTRASSDPSQVLLEVEEIDQPKTWAHVLDETTAGLIRHGEITEPEARLCHWVGRFDDECWPIKPNKQSNAMENHPKNKDGSKGPKRAKKA